MIIEKIVKQYSSQEAEKIIEAHTLAKEAHEGQFRESGEPLIEESSSLSYPLDKLEGIDFDATLFYNFNPGTKKLTCVSMGITSSTFEDKKVARLISTLEEKYGEPEKSEISEVRYDYKWETERTRITVKQLYSYTLVIYSDVTVPEEAEQAH